MNPVITSTWNTNIFPDLLDQVKGTGKCCLQKGTKEKDSSPKANAWEPVIYSVAASAEDRKRTKLAAEHRAKGSSRSTAGGRRCQFLR